MVSVNRSLLIHLPEIVDIQRAALHAPRGLLELKILAELTHKGVTLPFVSLDIGSRDPKAPTFLLVGGVHGLERIGTRVVNSFVRSLIQLSHWDEGTHQLLERCRFRVLPIINPIGMYFGTRSNGNGVDLMRNAPIEAIGNQTPRVAGGHRISPVLPWYRGPAGGGLETECEVVRKVVEEDLKDAPQLIILDVHSGFGAVDRLWFPYAKTAEPFPHLAEIFNLTRLLDRVYPHHIYRVEPQAKSYTTHGDLWDYLYDRNLESGAERVIIPLTLELGSWLWIKKNPIQLFSALGIFNPLLPHRTQRILRRHIALLDFLLRATANPKSWLRSSESHKEESSRLALQKWYQKTA